MKISKKLITIEPNVFLWTEMHPSRVTSGKNMLIINGSMSDCRNNFWLYDAMTKLGYNVLTYDHRGMGRSTMDPNPSNYTMAQYAKDAHQVVLSQGWSQPHVFGISFGGMVAQEYAIRYPTTISTLVLACTSAGGGKPSLPLYQLVMEKGDLRTAIICVQKMDTIFEKIYLRWVPYLVGTIAYLLPSWRHLDKSIRSLYWNKCRLYQFRARSQHNTCDRLHQITVPTLVCGGNRDRIAPPDNLKYLETLLKTNNQNVNMKLFYGGHGFLSQDNLAIPFIGRFIEKYIKK